MRLLESLRTTLRRDAAAVHRKAEIARRANKMHEARRLFAIKNRFEFVGAALGDRIASNARREAAESRCVAHS